MFNRLRSVIKTDEIEFLCDPKDHGIIPEPVPSNRHMPEWFKYLPAKVNKEEKLENSTIKRCAPFLDALTIGWIIPLCADVQIVTNEDASGVDYKWLFDKPVIENHSMAQVGTDAHPNDQFPKPPMKFLNYWMIKVPKGYSVLFTPPLNRADPRFTCFSGIVDDGYLGTDCLEYINFPFFFHEKNFTGVLKAGTPLVQVIPFKTDDMIKKYSVKKASTKDLELREHTRRRRLARESIYRNSLWRKK
jgi:hypothetical protein